MTLRKNLLGRPVRRPALAAITAFAVMMSMFVTPMIATAAIGASSTTSAPLTTAGPDLRTAAVDDIANKRVRFCFDQTVANFAASQGYFHLNGYNDTQVATGTFIAGDSNPSCVLVEFTSSEAAITQYTIATVDPGALTNATASNSNVEGAAALTGSTPGAGGIGGKTSTADLTTSTAKNGTNGINYVFDEVLDATYGSDGCDEAFVGFYESDGDRVLSATSCIVTPGSSTANAVFADASTAVRFFVMKGAVQDRAGDTGAGEETNPLSSTTQTHTTTADLSSVGRVNPTTVTYTFDQGDPASAPPTCTSSLFHVYDEDGFERSGSGDCAIITNNASSLVVQVSGFSTANFSSFETPSASVENGALTGSVINTDGARPLGTSQEASGFTDAPDLESADFDTAFSRVTFNYDENVDPTSVDPLSHCVVDNNDVETCVGSVHAATGNNQVTIQFSSGAIITAVGALVITDAVADYGVNSAAEAAVGRGPAPSQGTIQFSSASLSVNESAGACSGGGAQLTVTRTGGSSGAASVNFATSNGSATAGSDYSSTSGALNWTNGDSSSRTVCASILQDVISESSETFTVTLSGATGAALGTPSVATVTILDDDAGQGNLSFSSSTYVTGESNNALITVVRSGGSAGTVTVNYSTSNGSAVAGQDYTGTFGTLVFGTGTTSQSFTVPITNDLLDESDETVNLSLSSPGGGAGLTFPSSAVLTIVDNDTVGPGTLSLSSASYSVNENAGPATITVIRTNGSAGTVTVQYSVTSSSATSGSDFTATSGTLTFADGDVSETFSVPITNDSLDENDETANVTLSSPGGGATLGSPSTATLTIVDDDVPATASVDSRVTLFYGRAGDRFRGRVSVIGGTGDQPTLCRAGRTVALKKRGQVLDSTTSGLAGRWTLGGFSDPNGRYVAVVRRKVLTLNDGSTLICRRAQSPSLFL